MSCRHDHGHAGLRKGHLAETVDDAAGDDLVTSRRLPLQALERRQRHGLVGLVGEAHDAPAVVMVAGGAEEHRERSAVGARSFGEEARHVDRGAHEFRHV